jgi:hypothetical protein
MPRGRAALTDKEERILVQDQLMGLSTQSMVKIGNRLKALEQERNDMAHIDSTCQGFVFPETVNLDQLEITSPDGHKIEAVRGKKGTSRWGYYTWTYDIKVTKPGTRFKTRTYKNKELQCEYDWKKKLMPSKSKELYSLIRWTKNAMPWDLDFETK